jgi:peptide/nickel transport system ATP-binding protein
MSEHALLAVQDLSVHVGPKTLLHPCSFTLEPGQCLTVVGESGAGKSLLAQAIMGMLPEPLQARGHVCLQVQGQSTHRSAAADGPLRRPLWGRVMTLLPQEPAVALDPLLRVQTQLDDSLRWVRGLSGPQVQATRTAELAQAGLQHAGPHYAWQLSGGMAQRAAASIACAGGARMVLADEPTKGLDAHWRDHTVRNLQALQQAGGCVVVITHDLRVAQAMGGQLMVLQAGHVVEQGLAADILAQPQHPYTRQWLAATPHHWPQRAPAPVGRALVQLRNVSKRRSARTLFEGINLDVCAGQRWVIQGPSGAGKSTLGNVLLGLLAPDTGQVSRAPGLLPTAFQKLYQDPVASFPPHSSLAHALQATAQLHRQPWSAATQHLQRLGVATDVLERTASQVSGGELQRIALARTLLARPALLFADEPTSRLDPIIQKECMDLLVQASTENDAALVLVTHDEDIAHAVGSQHLRV